MIVHLRTSDLEERDLNALAPMTVPEGLMFPELEARWRDGRDSDVYLSLDLFAGTSPVHGWAHVFYGKHSPVPDFHVFVREEFRRSGIGTALFNRAREDHGALRVFRSGDLAKAFYDTVEKLQKTP